MKPSFHKVYSGPGYPTARRSAPLECWSWKPFESFRSGRPTVEELLRIYGMDPLDLDMRPTGRHENDLLRLPLGACIRKG